jgi:hypothetical protein
MQNYTIWKDNLLEEYFALETSEFKKYPKLKEVLISEKVQFSYLDAISIPEAISLYKKQLADLYVSNEENNEANLNINLNSTTSNTYKLH